MSVLKILLIVVLILLVIGLLPVWPHAMGWGYGPSGLLLIVIVVLVVLALTGKL